MGTTIRFFMGAQAQPLSPQKKNILKFFDPYAPREFSLKI
jgi:hypothetical protein